MTTLSTRMMILSRCRLAPLIGRNGPSGRHAVSGYMQKAVLAVLAGCENEPVSMPELAEMAGCSEHGISSALRALRNDGLIEIVEPLPAGRMPYSWRIVWERLLDLVPEAMEAAA